MTTPNMGTSAMNQQDKPLSVGDWILTLIVLAIPLVNLVLLFYWALSSNSNINRKNYCIATLILVAIWTVLIVMLLFMGVFAGIMSDLPTTNV